MTVDALVNRAALLTAPGTSAIAVIRIAGSGVHDFLLRHFDRPVARLRCVHGILRNSAGAEIDDPLVVLDQRRDQIFADINLHGGTWVVQSTLQLLAECRFTIVASSDLADLECLDESDAIDREVNRELPSAATALAIECLLAQPAAWRALQSSPKVDSARAERMLADRALHHLLHPPAVAIVGPANVGKSTLANRLFDRDRVITADLPGTTRDWVEDFADIDGLRIRLLDTPGLRKTSDLLERAAIDASLPQIAAVDLILHVNDRATFEPLPDSLAKVPTVRVVNKSDLKMDGVTETLAISALKGTCIDQLRLRILQHFGCDQFDPHRARCWTERQRTILKSSLDVAPHC